ncbi:MAG: hypothetical protein AAGF11_34640 [Myxococcota bacterium]
MISLGRMLDAIEAEQHRKFAPRFRSAFEADLSERIVNVLDPTVVQTDIKRVDRDDEGTLVVYLRMTDQERIVMKWRWWLYHDGEGLRWWDAEDLQLGFRISTMMATSLINLRTTDDSEEFMRLRSSLCA